jgi:hypothetical protein
MNRNGLMDFQDLFIRGDGTDGGLTLV